MTNILVAAPEGTRVDVPVDIDSLDRFLRDKGCTMWMNWDITDAQERKEAIAWLQHTLLGLMAYV